MGKPLSLLLKELWGRTRSGFRLYHLWESIDPTVIDHAPASRPSMATHDAKRTPAELLDHIEPSAGGRDRERIIEYILRVLNNDNSNSPRIREEVPNALGIIVGRVFDATFESIYYDNERYSFEPKEVLYALRDDSPLSFLWEREFQREFDACLHEVFSDCDENRFDRFWDEYDFLIGAPLIPTEDRLNGLELLEQKAELKQNLVQHLSLLIIASLFGPDTYFADLGLTPPGRAATPPLGFRPPRVDSPIGARLQPVIMMGSESTQYYTDTKSKTWMLDDPNASYVIGRNPEIGESETAIAVRSSLSNVSRRHAIVGYQERAGWILSDVGTDKEGSLWGTLVLFARGGFASYVEETVQLHHGDIICLAPDAVDGEDRPFIGVEGLSFRFEIAR